MKHILFCVALLFLISLNGFSQTSASSADKEFQSFFDIGIGVGPNYGILGGKAVVGLNGTGLMIGIGSFDGMTTTSIGFQVTYESFFANLSVADYGSYEVSWPGFYEKGLVRGTVFIVGGKIGIGKEKKLYVDIGVGAAGGGETPSPFGNIEESVQLSLSAGLNYRIGSK